MVSLHDEFDPDPNQSTKEVVDTTSIAEKGLRHEVINLSSAVFPNSFFRCDRLPTKLGVVHYKDGFDKITIASSALD